MKHCYKNKEQVNKGDTMQEKQAFGGDDDSTPQEQLPVKKPVLHKFASKPDANIRDIFWDIIADYAMKKPPARQELESLNHERMALLRIALSVMENPKTAYLGLSRNFTALYSLKLFLDAGWLDVVEEFLVKSYEEHKKAPPIIVAAIKKLLDEKTYGAMLTELFKNMIRTHNATAATLAFISKVGDKKLILLFKKEILIIARNDIEDNQFYAMHILAQIMNEEAKMTLMTLMSHWDEEVRLTAVNLLKKEKDPQIVAAAQRQYAIETNPAIKKMLARVKQG